MNILVTNDDGVYAPGILKLSELAKEFGTVTVVAPACQCSAMSHSISLMKQMNVKQLKSYPVNGVRAFSLEGTPADCSKAAIEFFMEKKPDIVFSGINRGWNAGIDVVYSGTVAAGMEAVLKGIPAIAFSTTHNDSKYELVEAMFRELVSALVSKEAGQGKMWNVNFPDCPPSMCNGILMNRNLSKKELYPDYYRVVAKEEDGMTIILDGEPSNVFDEDSDLYALLHNYISVGTITNMVMGY